MSYINAREILSSINEVIDEGAGAFRTIAADRFSTGTYEGQPADESSRLAVVKPRYDVNITGTSINPASPPRLGNKIYYDVEIEVTVIRHLRAIHKVDGSVRDDVMGLSFQDADVLVHALTFPGNLSAETGLASRCLQYVGSTQSVNLSEGEAGSVVTSHKFTGIAIVTITSPIFLPDENDLFPDEA